MIIDTVTIFSFEIVLATCIHEHSSNRLLHLLKLELCTVLYCFACEQIWELMVAWDHLLLLCEILLYFVIV